MSTGYGWEGLRHVGLCVTLLIGARHVGLHERHCGGLVYLGRYNKRSPLPFDVASLQSINTFKPGSI